MLGTEFVELFTTNKLLREYICRMARVHSNNATIQEDLIQEAWIRVSECPVGCDLGFYYCEAYRAIHACYCREWRSWKRGSDKAAANHRLRERIRYYLKRNLRK